LVFTLAIGHRSLSRGNFRHINNAEMKSAIARVVESLGFECPQICSPEELGGESDD
jgi:hypothetical protein